MIGRAASKEAPTFSVEASKAS